MSRRILLWANFADRVGGGERSTLELARGLAAAGEAVVVAAPGEGEVLAAARAAGIPGRVLAAPSLRACALRPDRFFAARRALHTAADRFDVLHLSSPRQIPLVLGAGRTWIYHLRVAAPDPAVDRLVLRADAVIANSRATAARAAGHPRLRVVPNGIDASAWRADAPVREAARRAAGLAPQDRAILLAGRATSEKGFLDAVPSIAEILAADPRARVLVAGDWNTDEGRAAAGVLRRAGRSHVRLLGSVEDLREALAAADLVVIPSRVEGFGRVALEAMAAGTAVAARAVGGLPEVLGDAGLLLDPPSPGWRAAIGDLLFDDARRAILADRGLVRAGAFPLAAAVAGVRAVYDEVAPIRTGRVRRAARRILFATNDYPPASGGMSEYARGFAEGLAAKGYDCEVLARDFAPAGEAPAFLPSRRFVLPARRLATAGPLGESVRLAAEIRRTLAGRPAPDLVWAITWAGWGPALRSLQLPYVLSVHGADLLCATRAHDRLAARWTLRGARRVLANSEFTAREVLRASPGAHLTVLPPGVDYDRFAAPPAPGAVEALRARYGLEGKRVILTVGSLVRRKGHDLVLRALALLEDRPELVAVFVGGWSLAHPAERELKDLASRLGVASRVRFVGVAPDAEVPAWMRAAEIFAMPGRHQVEEGWVEGYGIAYLEAAAAGLPAIGAAAGGAPEAVRDEETGLLVPPEDPQALAGAIARLLDDGALRARLAANGPGHARENGWDRRVEGAARILEEIL